LLAGLWDFPVVPNVGTSDPKSLEKHARDLVLTAFPQLELANDEDEGSPSLQISSLKVIGSVLHVFSHVRKTFQVICIAMRSEGGDSEEGDSQPPNAVPGRWMDDAQREPDIDEESVKPPAKKKQKVMSKKKKKGKGDESGSDAEAAELESSERRLKWTMEANVGQENLGTGTMKVWSLAQTGTGGKSIKAPKSVKKKAETTEPEKKATLLNYFQKATRK
ncbi:hypothetical protein FRC17_007847, partial [Serendipita sp. 399]